MPINDYVRHPMGMISLSHGYIQTVYQTHPADERMEEIIGVERAR